MSDNRIDREMLASVIGEAAEPGHGGHLELDELVQYHEGRLDPEGEARVQDHLVGCRECTTTLLDLDSLSAGDSEPDRSVAELDTAAAWRDMQRRMDGNRAQSTVSGTGRGWRAMAAALAIAALGLTFATLHFRREANELLVAATAEAPRVNPTIVYLDAVTRGAQEGSGVTAVDASEDFLIIFTPATLESFEHYAVEFRNADGDEIWRQGGIRLTRHGTVRIEIPGGWLPAGELAIDFYGIDGSRLESVGGYALTVRSDP